MSHDVQVSDEIFRAIETLARAQGMTPQALAEALLRERLAERQALLVQNAEWEASLDEALGRAERGENVRYASTDAFFAALDALPLDGSNT